MESEVLSMYIKKLGHPIKEIRERSLKLLGAKLKLGWILEDELAGTRDLLNVLLSWFHKQQPSLQKEALELLLATVKTKSGSYIVKEMGTANLLSTINTIKHKIASDAIDSYQELIETLTFLNSVQSEDDLSVPHLNIPSITSSESEGGSSSGYYNVGYDSQTSKDDKDATESSENNYCSEQDLVKLTDSIKVVLFPWVDLCPSDSKTMLLIEDALKLFKSTRRCCRFIHDVYLRDFPPEIFLNRPSIIQNLLTISKENNSRRPEEALIVLMYITKALCKRIPQLTSLHLIHAELKFTEDNKGSVDNVNLELGQMAGEDVALHQEDSLIALKQLPAPIYALDTLHSILAIMLKNVVDDDTNNNSTLDLNINLCINLTENLIQLLLDCVQEQFWTSEHRSKIHRDTEHKSCMVFRLLGDLTTKYRKQFFDDLDKNQYRVWWLRLIICSERLLRWARESALPPATLTAALQAALLDPAVELFYPQLSQKIADLFQNAKVSNDQEFKNKYKQLTDLVSKMDDAVIFMKNKNCCRNSKTVLMIIKNSLPVLELHLNEAYVQDVAEIILTNSKGLNFDDIDWDIARNIALHLMSHRIDWVQIKFYRMLADMVKTVIVGDNDDQAESEKCLNLLCDVGILSEICCHGLLSNLKEVEESASEVMVYLLRGRLALSESCWWKLLASLLPILPLLHVYAAHETQLGKAICKSLEAGIAERMGVCAAERVAGLTRLLFVRCVAVQFDAAHELTAHIDDDRYLPPKEILRADVLVNALRRVEPREFNVDYESSPSKSPQTTGLIQILEVLKQDIMLDENGVEFVPRASIQPTLDPSLRRSTLQQLAVVMRQPEVHGMFLKCDGLKVVVAILRMSLMVEDYLAFPECATSCVSILNSICFVSRHDLSKIPDLPALLIRVILVFPANEWCVSMCAQVLCVCAWAGFCLHELRAQHSRARPEPALPHCVVTRTLLPLHAHEYWTTSPNALHSSVEWLLGDEEFRLSLRVRWWCAWAGSGRGAARGAPPPPAPLALRPAPRDAAALHSTCPTTAATQELMNLENATSHRQVVHALSLLENYVHLQRTSSISNEEFGSLPWHKMQRFLVTSPSSPRDIALMISLLQFIIMYMDNANYDKNALSWILSNFITDDAFVITLLSKEQLYPQQSQQDCIEVTQLHIHIVKIILRCVLSLDKIKDYNTKNLESLVKILLVCLERLDLKNFHMLGYLNELLRCIRYTINSFNCKLTEETVLDCMRILTRTLSGCASGGGRKGQACRLDALLALLALLKMTHNADIPVQRWSEYWSGSEYKAVVRCGRSERAELRAAAVHALAALAHHAHCMPHLMQAIPCPSLSQYAIVMFTNRQEANVVRAAAAHLLTTVTSRTTPHCDMSYAKEGKYLMTNVRE